MGVVIDPAYFVDIAVCAFYLQVRAGLVIVDRDLTKLKIRRTRIGICVVRVLVNKLDGHCTYLR